MSEGDNKRVVKKGNTKKMNIKVSTEDKETPVNNELNKEKKTNSNNSKSPKKEEKTEMNLTQLIENNQNLENELINVKEELKNEEEVTLNEISPLNEEIENLNKLRNNVCNQNKTLMNRLKKMEEEITKKYNDKFKVSKIIEKQKYNIYNRDINTEIKSKENEKNNVQKDIKYNKKEIDRLNKILEQNNSQDGDKLKEQYIELKNDIQQIQKELDDLNKIKFEHKNCSKNSTILKSRLNVLFNDIEFESKRKIMISTILPKKEKTVLFEGNKKDKYGKKIRKNMLNNAKNKYDSKNGQFIIQRSYNLLKGEIDENEKEKERVNKSSGKINKDDLGGEDEVNNNKNKETQKVYLFTEAEKEVFKRIVPNELYNNLNEKYNQKETEMKEIEETYKEPKEMKRQLYLDNLRYEEINLKQQELRMRKTNLMAKQIKNSKKIIEIKNILKLKQMEIDKEAKRLKRYNEKNNNLNEIIKKYIDDKKKEKEEAK